MAGVNGADRRHRRAALERREVGDDELRAVEEIQRHAVALFHPEGRERIRQPVGGFAQLPIRDHAAVEGDCGALRRALGRRVEGLVHGLGRDLDASRHTGGVMGEPGPRQVRLDCAHLPSAGRL